MNIWRAVSRFIIDGYGVARFDIGCYRHLVACRRQVARSVLGFDRIFVQRASRKAAVSVGQSGGRSHQNAVAVNVISRHADIVCRRGPGQSYRRARMGARLKLGRSCRRR
ncbi:hypothetical protein D3C71_1517060 [compost metagenome]